MPRINVKCPRCNLSMTGTDPERFRRPITCPKCYNVFSVAVAQGAPKRMTPPPLPPTHAPKRSPLRLFGVAGLMLILAVSVGAYFGYPLLKDRSGRRGSGSPGGEAGGDGGTRHALLIGVNEYDNLGHLRFAGNDAIELADVLGAAGYEVTLLTTSEGRRDPSRAPNQANVKDHLARIARKCKRADTLVLAFAGHGMQFDDQAYFCPSDADERWPESMVSLTRVYAEMGDSKAGARLLLVDACRNDGRRSARRGVTGTHAPPSGVAALFSCKQGEFANETAELRHGIFFHFVLQGLKGEALNRDGEVTWDGLNEYVKKQVSRNVGKMAGGGAKQTPHALANLEGESPVLVSDAARRLRPAEAPPVKSADKDGVKEPVVKSNLGESFTNSIGMRLVRVKAGEFTMGSPEGEAARSTDEVQHKVEITKDFYLGVFEVTQKQYAEVMNKNPSWFSKGGFFKDRVQALNTDDFPVENVSWLDAQDFLDALNAQAEAKQLRVKYRLPSEAEWEYACRGGPSFSNKRFHFKSSPSDSLGATQANFDTRSPYGAGKKGDWLFRTNTVGKNGEPNALGLYDMHGNVLEWCQDWYAEDTYTKEARCDPSGPGMGTARVLRGGSWGSFGWFCRSASRISHTPGHRDGGMGFRVAASPAE